MPYDPNEPRDVRGRWTATELLYPSMPGPNSNIPGKRYVSRFSVDEMKRRSGTYVATGPDTGSHQCVPLVKALIPKLGPTGDWTKGADITGLDDPNLQPGTAIGKGWDADGNYPNKDHGNHVAIVARIDRRGDGQPAVWVFDQWEGHPAQLRPLNAGEERSYSVVTRKR